MYASRPNQIIFHFSIDHLHIIFQILFWYKHYYYSALINRRYQFFDGIETTDRKELFSNKYNRLDFSLSLSFLSLSPESAEFYP